MYDFANQGTPDLEQLRGRLSGMPDGALRRFGSAARYMWGQYGDATRPGIEKARIPGRG